MTPKYTEDKRLLGALDYIDDKFIAEVTESYKIFEPSDGKITAHRTLKISLRQFAALAACLILLSAAFPVVNYAVKIISSFAAGWGSVNEYGSKYDRAIDAYPDDMPVEDIYEDVLKGGWLVDDYSIASFGADAGIELWNDFYENVQAGKPTSLLSAAYDPKAYNPDDYYNLSENAPRTILPGIILQEICYDGKVFTLKERSYIPTYPNYDAVASEIRVRQYQYVTVTSMGEDADWMHVVLSNSRPVTINEYLESILGVGDLSIEATFGPRINKSDFYLYYGSDITN